MRHPVLGSAVAAMAVFMAASTPIGTATAAGQGDGISLAVTVGLDPTSCGTDTTLAATAGDQINYCYTVTNDSSTTLAWHTLADDLNGPLFTAMPATIAPGATYQYNRLVTVTGPEAPTSTWTAYDVHPDYVYSENTPDADAIFANGFEAGTSAQYGFVDITQTGTNLMLNDDDYIAANIGFSFTFYSQTSDQLTVYNNGGMLFDLAGAVRGRQGYLSPTNRVLPDRLIGPAILPYWEDMQQDYIDGIGNVFVQTLGDAPNRRFVVEWFNLPVNFGGGSETVTYEAILFEGSNDILFQYKDVDCGSSVCDNGAGATIGLNFDGVHGIPYSFKQPVIASGKAILFHPSDSVTYTASQQVTLDVGAPVIGVDPAGGFGEVVNAGASTTDTMTIANTGNRPLTWNVGSVGNAKAHFPPVSRFALPMGDPSKTRFGPAPVAVAAKHVGPHPLAAGGVTAYAADVNNSVLYSFDATSPADATEVGSLNGLNFLTGDFAGEDFSTLYAIDFRSFCLYKIDTATGATTLVYLAVPPDGAAADAWTGMSWDPTTNTMYAITTGGRTPASYLIKIDLATAQTQLVGQITGVGDPDNGTMIIDIAVDTNGLMYGVDIITDTLVAIDKTTGEASTIGSIGFDANYSEGLDFDDTTHTLYFSAYDYSLDIAEMYTLDLDTGLGTPIAPIGPSPEAVQFSALGIARLAGICAYPSEVPWLSFSSTRGSTQPGDTTPITVTFDATDLAPGRYASNICVNNNDLTNQRLAVPVSLTVQ